MGRMLPACANGSCVLTLTVFLIFSHSPGVAQEMPWLSPPALEEGDVIMFVAPAGPADRQRVLEFRRILERKGYKAIVPANLFRSDRYLAGDDATRAAELNAAIRNPEVDAVFPCRGGYGLTRILDQIDYEELRKNPKLVIGFSDITALHLAIARKTRLITLHSPMPQAYLFSNAESHRTSNGVFWSFINGKPYGNTDPPIEVIRPAIKPRIKTVYGGSTAGRLVGGNLTLICATLGTPYAIEPEGKILVIEDTGESPYRIDRYMSQLKLAGVLDQLAGVIVGDFSDAQPDADRVIAEYIQPLGIPAISGFPIGHEAENLTLPLGASAVLNADTPSLSITEWPFASKAPERN